MKAPKYLQDPSCKINIFNYLIFSFTHCCLVAFVFANKLISKHTSNISKLAYGFDTAS